MTKRWKKIQGLVSAPYTPFHANGALHEEAIAIQADAARNVLAGVFICGTTGEGISMTVDERMRVAEAWMRHRSPDLKVIVHVGTTSLLDAKRLASHAQQIGADGVASMAPLAFRPAGTAGLADYLAEIANAAPELPFLYYHMPSFTGFPASMLDFIPRAIDKIPTFAGIKYTHEDLFEFAQMIEEFGDEYDMIFGRDEYLIHALQIGATGAVGSTYNYMAPIYLSLMRLIAAGNTEDALALHLRVLAIIRVLIKYGGGVIGGKIIMKIIGQDMGPCRAPLPAFGEKEVEAMRAELQQVGFFDAGVLGESFAAIGKR